MNEESHYFSRRTFLKTAAGGAASILGALGNPAMASQPQAVMPTRPFGRTGIDVPILSFGGSLNTSLSTLLLRQAVKWGVAYWDTANSYMGGRSERAWENISKNILPTANGFFWLRNPMLGPRRA